MNQAAIGQYIAGKRTAQGMTQEQLAQKIGVSQKSLMLDLLRRMQRTVYEQHILYGVLLILLGIASNALSALVGGSHVKEFFSGVLMGMSVAEMLAGVVIVAIHVIHGKCEE